MILKPLQRIQVIDSVKKHKAGSLGYLVTQDPWARYNAWDMCVVFTRSGKRGIPKIELSNIRPFMIDYSTMKQPDAEILNIVKSFDGLEPQPGFTNETVGDTSIAPLPTGPKDILELSDNEFMAYIISLSLATYKMINRIPTCKLSSFSGFAPYKFSEFINNNFDLKIPPIETLGYHLLYGIKIDNRKKRAKDILPEGAKPFAECYDKQVDTKAKRKDLLDKLQLSFAMSQAGVKQYGIKINSAFSRNTQNINEILKYYKQHKKELSEIKEGGAAHSKERMVRGRPLPKKRLVLKKKKNVYIEIGGN